MTVLNELIKVINGMNDNFVEVPFWTAMIFEYWIFGINLLSILCRVDGKVDIID